MMMTAIVQQQRSGTPQPGVDWSGLGARGEDIPMGACNRYYRHRLHHRHCYYCHRHHRLYPCHCQFHHHCDHEEHHHYHCLTSDHLNGGFFLKTVDWFNVYHSRMSIVCSVPWLSITKCCISRSKTLWHPLHYLLGASIEACRRPFDRNCFSLIKKSGGVLYWLTLTSNTCYT